MAYLIDSDWVIDHLTGIPDASELLLRLAPAGIAISIITYMEVYQGVLMSTDQAAAELRFRELVETLPLLPLSPAVARRCAAVRADLRRQGRRVGGRALDLIIAATALEFNLTLVTRNLRDYRDIPGFSLLDLPTTRE